MKISILTATYNRGTYLNKLYKSLIKNSKYGIDLEWLVMDDGSTDDTTSIVKSFIEKNNFVIKYFYQENQGKMTAINNLTNLCSGDLIIECDSDDYFTDNSFQIIGEKYSSIKSLANIYALGFLKYDSHLNNIGNLFKEDNYKTTMFDLYFKDGLTGDKLLVFNSKLRKKYSYQLEKNEKFSTEARLYNEMDKKYKIICFNFPVMICEYLDTGYSKNIKKLFKENPYGYFEYFKQLLSFNMKNVLFKKRLYIIKHYILFCYLTKQKHILKNVNGKLNKFLIIILLIPGYIKTYMIF